MQPAPPGQTRGQLGGPRSSGGRLSALRLFFRYFWFGTLVVRRPPRDPRPIVAPNGDADHRPPCAHGGQQRVAAPRTGEEARGARTHYFRVVALPPLRRQGLLHRAAWGRSAREAGGSCPLPPLRPPPSRGGLHVTLLARVRDHLVERAQDFVGLARGQPTHGGALGCGGPGCLGPGGVRRGAA